MATTVSVLPLCRHSAWYSAVDGSYSAAFLAEVKNVIENRDWAQALSA